MSITFNGSTSNLAHATADVLLGAQTFSACCSVFADTVFGPGLPTFINLPEAYQTENLGIRHENFSNSVRVVKGCGTQEGIWRFTMSDNAWHTIGMSFDFSSLSNDPIVRVDLANVSVPEIVAPSGTILQPPTGYCLGHEPLSGRISFMFLHNVILTSEELDEQCRNPGNITRGMQVGLMMTNVLDILDISGNGFNPTATALADGAGPPSIPAGGNSNRLYGKFAKRRQQQTRR